MSKRVRKSVCAPTTSPTPSESLQKITNRRMRPKKRSTVVINCRDCCHCSKWYVLSLLLSAICRKPSSEGITSVELCKGTKKKSTNKINLTMDFSKSSTSKNALKKLIAPQCTECTPLWFNTSNNALDMLLRSKRPRRCTECASPCFHTQNCASEMLFKKQNAPNFARSARRRVSTPKTVPRKSF